MFIALEDPLHIYHVLVLALMDSIKQLPVHTMQTEYVAVAQLVIFAQGEMPINVQQVQLNHTQKKPFAINVLQATTKVHGVKQIV